MTAYGRRLYTGKQIKSIVADNKTCRIPTKLCKDAEKQIKNEYGKVEPSTSYVPKKGGAWVKAPANKRLPKTAYSGRTISLIANDKNTRTASGAAAQNAVKALKKAGITIEDNTKYENVRYTPEWRAAPKTTLTRRL